MSSNISTSFPSRVLSILRLSSKSAQESPSTTTTAQQVTCALPAPPPATYTAYHEPRTTTNVMDEFFGDSAPPYRPTSRLSTSPPPYAPYGHRTVEVQPGVYAVQEPRTLARMLFYYGFLFFPFWFVGIWLVISPMQPTEDWETGKSEYEKAQLLKTLRTTEKKWALRCLYAACTFFTILVGIIVAVKFVLRH